MSRSGYREDCENLNLYRGNVGRCLGGKKGQAFLKELLSALDGIGDKRLIAHELIVTDADKEDAIKPLACGVCAIGSVGVAREMDMSKIIVDDPRWVAEAFGIPPMLAAEIEYVNDEGTFMQETDEERWQRVRNWVESEITAGAG